MKLCSLVGFIAVCLVITVTGRQSAAQTCESTALTFDDCENKILKGKDYTGSVSQTKSGYTCSKWTRKGRYTKTGDHNFCRNPSKADHVWCYTTKSKPSWEYCDVPICGVEHYQRKIMKINETYTACSKSKVDETSTACEGCQATIKKLMLLIDQTCQPTHISFDDCESYLTKGKDYTGSVSQTKSGYTCSKWTRKGRYTKTGNHNFCRNPSKAGHVWCYTTKSKPSWEYCDVPICGIEHYQRKIMEITETYKACTKSLEKSKVDIKKLMPLIDYVQTCHPTYISFDDCESHLTKGKDYTGRVSQTKSGYTCQKWTTTYYPKTGDHNFCRNPSAGDHVWCYTTDPKSPDTWEYCDVPKCEKMEKMEKKMRKEKYTTCINNPQCKDCKEFIEKALPTLIREDIIKEGEIGDESTYLKKVDQSKLGDYLKKWVSTLILRNGNDIITTVTNGEIVTLNGTVNGYVGGKRWYGDMKHRPTGLYASPGQMITITFPEQLLGKVGVYIGHNEYNEYKIYFPPMQKSVFKIGSPFGGLIVLWLEERDAIKGNFNIIVDNAIKAPNFILGTTTNQEWNEEIKHYSPKWAVLQVPGQLDIYVQSLKLIDITDMEGQMNKIKKSIDVLERMLGLPEGSQPGAERLIFDPGMDGGNHKGKCMVTRALVGDKTYPLKEGEKYTYYDDFFKTLGTNNLIGHELGHGFCYGDFPDMGNQWTAEFVESYQRWRMGNPDEHSPKKSWWMNSTDLDFHLLDKMVSFSLYSDEKPCGKATFANKNQLYEYDYDKCWKWLNWIPQRLHGWQVWDKLNALDAKSKTRYTYKEDRMVDLYCQATGHNMLPLFDLYNINKANKLSQTVINNCIKFPESNILKEWLEVTECVKQSMKGTKNIRDCEDMPRFPPHEGLCLLNGICRRDQTTGGTTQMKNRFDLKGTYKDYDLTAHSEKTCLKRAPAFFEDCKNEDSQAVTATWVTKDGNSKSRTFPHQDTCPEGHTAFSNHCYFPSFKDGKEAVGRKGWLDARNYCRELSKKHPTYKYDLVSLQNEAEYNFILNNEWSEIYKKWKAQFGIWIGLNDRDEEGKWTWSDGAPLEYANPRPTAQTPPWKRGEPSYGDEDCVRTYGLEGLTDRDCNIKIQFICEGQKESGGN